jgi:serine/threonine protein kinase
LSRATSLSLAFSYAPVDLYLSSEWRRRSFLPLLPFDVVKTIARDIFAALAHCHHRDVKPGNLLVTSAGVIQLCDFGLAKPFLAKQPTNNDNNDNSQPPITAGESGTKGLCTLYYRPPEVLLGGPATDPAIDMCSAGMSNSSRENHCSRVKMCYISWHYSLINWGHRRTPCGQPPKTCPTMANSPLPASYQRRGNNQYWFPVSQNVPTWQS